MGIKLIIAEKPSVAKEIGKVLKCTKKADGYIFGEQYIITWAIGHLVTLCDPEDYSKDLKKWNVNTLPIKPDKMKLKAVKSTRKQLEIVYKLINNEEVESLICATDSGREGELIFRYIYDIAKCKKPFERLWISSMTDKAIKDGFKKLKNGCEYDNLYYSAKCRSEADWLVGINATRAFTLKYNTLLSIGRVQTPTLAIVVDRQKEINNFKPELYYEILSQYENFKGKWIDKSLKNSKIKNKENGNKILEDVKGKIGIVKSLKKENKKERPPLLYDLTELQIDCNKKYGYTAKKTLQIAQDLYEKKKMITYPRTDSKYLSSDMKSKIQSIIKSVQIEQYDEYVQHILNKDKLNITSRIINDNKVTDHHAIIPTGKKLNFSNFSRDEFNVIDLIVRRFLGAFYEDYLYSVTTAIVDINAHNFISKGTVIKQLGFNELYKNFKNSKTEKDVLPNLTEGDEVKLIKATLSEKKTKPPKLYTEATLLSAMEHAGRFVEDEAIKESLRESGMGTPATRASIIERLVAVKYVERRGKTIVPTDKGMKVIEVVPNELKSPEITGKWEKGLNLINKGEMDINRFMGSINKFVDYIIVESNKNTDVVFENEGFNKSKVKKIETCPKCKKGIILENAKAYYCSNWKQNCKISIWKNSLEKYSIENISKEDVKLIINNNFNKIINGNNISVKLDESLTGKLLVLVKKQNESVTLQN